MLEIMEAFKQAEKKVKKEKPVEKPQYDKMMHLSKLKKIMDEFRNLNTDDKLTEIYRQLQEISRRL